VTARQPQARRCILNVEIDPVDQAGAITRILQWCRDGRSEFVVTPNLDHVVKLEKSPAFRAAYKSAALVLADGAPLVLLSGLAGPRLPHVTGADLVEPLCAAAAVEGRSVFLFGTTLGVLAGAARALARRCPGLEIAGIYAPPFGFERSAEEKRLALAAINDAAPAIVFVALGAPKQEIWAHEVLPRIDANALVCVGAALDFIAGGARRAPRPLRRLKLEWLWRAASEPRRLGTRYARIALALPVLMLRFALRDRLNRGRA
jgi:exopolysaccharide biosynthesis WecB/TagA/CpsF family protein